MAIYPVGPVPGGANTTGRFSPPLTALVLAWLCACVGLCGGASTAVNGVTGGAVTGVTSSGAKFPGELPEQGLAPPVRTQKKGPTGLLSVGTDPPNQQQSAEAQQQLVASRSKHGMRIVDDIFFLTLLPISLLLLLRGGRQSPFTLTSQLAYVSVAWLCYFLLEYFKKLHVWQAWEVGLLVFGCAVLAAWLAGRYLQKFRAEVIGVLVGGMLAETILSAVLTIPMKLPPPQTIFFIHLGVVIAGSLIGMYVARLTEPYFSVYAGASMLGAMFLITTVAYGLRRLGHHMKGLEEYAFPDPTDALAPLSYMLALHQEVLDGMLAGYLMCWLALWWLGFALQFYYSDRLCGELGREKLSLRHNFEERNPMAQRDADAMRIYQDYLNHAQSEVDEDEVDLQEASAMLIQEEGEQTEEEEYNEEEPGGEPLGGYDPFSPQDLSAKPYSRPAKESKY
eukprot:g58348.t1